MVIGDAYVAVRTDLSLRGYCDRDGIRLGRGDEFLAGHLVTITAGPPVIGNIALRFCNLNLTMLST